MLQHSQCLKQSIVLRLEAARKTRHLYDRSYDWSPTWRKHDREVKLWRVAKKRFRQRVRGRFLRKLMREAGNTDCFQLNEEETIVRYTQAKEALEDFKPKAADYRREHLKALAKSLAEKNNTNEEAELKKLTSQEKQRKLGAKLKQTGKKGKKGLASKLATGPENDPTWTEDKEGVERLSGTENETRFTNCLKDSEFITDEGLLADVGILCTGPAVASILSGEHVPAPHLHKWTKMVLEFMPMPEIIKSNPMGTPNLTTEEHIKGWKKAKEGTASDPRTPDFSHYTSAAHDEALAAMDATPREIPMQHGFAPDEWNPMADCSIPKKEDSPRVKEMRTTCLMDAAYNMNNKWYGREFMRHDESLDTIPEEQSGSRKLRKSAEVALKKVLAMDLLRQFRRAGFLCSNDAIQCYDRMLHNVAMLSMLRLGADWNTLISLFGQLQQAEHSIMTAHGVSDWYYGGDLRAGQGKLPLQGVMQGNGMGPIIWLAISVVLLGIMHDQGFATVFYAAISLTQISMCGFTFVDDCDLIVAPASTDVRAGNYIDI